MNPNKAAMHMSNKGNMNTVLIMRNSKVRTFLYAVLGGAMLLTIYLLSNTHSKLKDVQESHDRCQQQRDSLSAQLQVVYEHKTRLEKSLQKEMTEKKKIEEEMKLVQEESEKAKMDSSSKYEDLMKKFEELKSAHHEEFSNLKNSFNAVQQEKEKLDTSMEQQKEYIRSLTYNITRLQNERVEYESRMAQNARLLDDDRQKLQACQAQYARVQHQLALISASDKPQGLESGPAAVPVAHPAEKDNVVQRGPPSETLKEKRAPENVNKLSAKEVSSAPPLPVQRSRSTATSDVVKLNAVNEAQLTDHKDKIPTPTPTSRNISAFEGRRSTEDRKSQENVQGVGAELKLNDHLAPPPLPQDAQQSQIPKEENVQQGLPKPQVTSSDYSKSTKTTEKPLMAQAEESRVLPRPNDSKERGQNYQDVAGAQVQQPQLQQPQPQQILAPAQQVPPPVNEAPAAQNDVQQNQVNAPVEDFDDEREKPPLISNREEADQDMRRHAQRLDRHQVINHVLPPPNSNQGERPVDHVFGHPLVRQQYVANRHWANQDEGMGGLGIKRGPAVWNRPQGDDDPEYGDAEKENDGDDQEGDENQMMPDEAAQANHAKDAADFEDQEGEGDNQQGENNIDHKEGVAVHPI